MKIILNLFVFSFIFFGCMVQNSSLKKINDSDIPLQNMGIIKYYGLYEMNMSKSKDIIVTLRNLNTGQEYIPKARTKEGMSVINVPEGEYFLSKLIIREVSFNKCLCKINNTDNYIYGFSDKNCSYLSMNGLLGDPVNGGLLLGEKYLIVKDKIIETFKIEVGKVYTANSLLIQGKVESLLKDLPNIEIIQTANSNTKNNIKFFKEDLIVIKRNKLENK